MKFVCGIIAVSGASVLADPDSFDSHGAEFIQGLMRGLSGDAEDFHDCSIKIGAIISDTKQLVADVKSRNFRAVFDDLKTIFEELTHVSAGQLELKLADGPADPLCKYDDPTAGEKQMWLPGCQGAGCKANTMDADCAWCIYDLDLCKSRYGDTCDETMSARQAQGVTACGSAPPTTSPVVDPTTSPVIDPTTSPVIDPTTSPVIDPTTSPVIDPTTSPVIDPTTSPVTDPTTTQESPPMPPTTGSTTTLTLVPGPYGGSCRQALADLKPLLNIMEGPLAKNAAQHFVDSYDDIVQLTGLVKHCGFVEPDGDQCGYMIGAITRDILAGAEPENLVLV